VAVSERRTQKRRTKLERADDLGLPPRTIVVRRDYFSPAEKELYKSLFSDAKRTFSTYVDAGTVLNSLLSVALQTDGYSLLVMREKMFE
jgi:DNA repair protein RAD16